MKAQELDSLGYCDAACGGVIVGVVSTYWGVGVGTVFPGVEETAGISEDKISVIQFSGIHGNRLSPDTVLLSVDEDSDITGAEEVLVRGILLNDAVFVVEMHIPESELKGVSMWSRLGVFTRSQTE